MVARVDMKVVFMLLLVTATEFTVADNNQNDDDVSRYDDVDGRDDYGTTRIRVTALTVINMMTLLMMVVMVLKL